MKKFLKILGILVIVCAAVLYCAFLFVLPKVVDLNEFKPELQKIVKEQTNLILDFDNPQITVTPLLSAGVKAENIKIKLPDNSEIVSADNFVGRISLPSLLLLTVKVSTAQIDNPIINIDIIDNKAFKAVQAYEEILNKKEENIGIDIQPEQKPVIDPSWIKIIVPKVKINNYIAKVNDLKTGDVLKLQGDELLLGYKNGKTASVKTSANLFINDSKNITANIDIDTIIPETTELDEEDDEAQRVEIPFVNPVAMYKSYDLKTNIDSKIKIREKDNNIVSYGYLNVDNFTLNLAGKKLPESKLHLKTRGTKANLDSDIFITQEEKISFLGMLNYGKHPEIDMKINSSEIHLANVINLIEATLDSLHIKNELNSIKGEGYFIADTYIKSNFKKLTSSGHLTIKDCVVKNISSKKDIAKVNSIISLEDSILTFTKTSIIIAETLFKIEGTIDEKSYADISLVMENMPLAKVFSMFLPSDINNTYTVNSGFINMYSDIKGELKKALANLKIDVNNVSLFDKVNKIEYLNNLLTLNFTSDFKKAQGAIKNSGFKLKMNGSVVSCDKFILNLSEKDITIEPSIIKINDKSIINFSGQLLDYAKNALLNFEANGNILASDIKQILGSDAAMYIKDKGIIPLNVNISGNKKKQTLIASVEADKNNYITPIDFQNVQDLNTVMQTVIDFKESRLKIKDTGFFIKTISQNPEKPEEQIINLQELVSIDGTITRLDSSNPNINLIKIKVPDELIGVIYAFPQSSLKAKGNLYAFGDMQSPRLRGEFNIWDISIPELMLTVDKIISKFEGKDLDIEVKNVNANGSDYNILINADLNPSQFFTIKNLNLISNLTDVDKLMDVSNAAMKYTPASAPDSDNSSSASDIPVIIKDGGIDIKQIKTGNIDLRETTAKIALSDSIFYVNNLITSGFKGKIRGDVSMNLLTNELKAVVKGSNLDVEQALLDAAGMKDTLTGTIDFDTDISLKGTSYEEQMKSLKGDISFEMKDGTLGPFGQLENLILAENIRESAFFQSTIGSVLNSLLSFDTSHYNTLKGLLSFNEGVAVINPITSEGDIMSMFIFGDFDLLANKIDIKLRGKLGSQVSDSLGPLALLNPVNLIKATPGMSLVLGKIFFLFTEQVTEAEMSQIPLLGKDISDNNATKFQVVVRGDVAKPLTLVKSFKWLALASDMEKASAYLKNIPSDTLPDAALESEFFNTEEETVNSAAEEVQQEIKESIFGKIKSFFKEKTETKQTTQEENKLQSIMNDVTQPVVEVNETPEE